MRTDNFIAFFTVCGFFIGLIFVTIKIDEPVELVLYTLLITFFFYIVIHIVIMNYVDSDRIDKKIFNKESYEEVNDYLINELTLRERKIDGIISINKTTQKKLDKKNERVKAKAA